MPNELKNALTVGTGVYAAFSKSGWLLLLCSYSLLAQLVGEKLHIVSFRENVNPEIQLEVEPEPCEYYSDALTTEPLDLQQKSRSKLCNSQASVWF